MPLSKEEWSIIEDTAYDVANGLSDNKRMLCELKKLRLKHGELPILLSTEADYTQSTETRLHLYKQAIELSQNPLDKSCLTQSAESIVEIYINELSDYNNGVIWLGKLKEFVGLHGCQHILNNVSELEAKLNRLKIHSV